MSAAGERHFLPNAETALRTGKASAVSRLVREFGFPQRYSLPISMRNRRIKACEYGGRGVGPEQRRSSGRRRRISCTEGESSADSQEGIRGTVARRIRIGKSLTIRKSSGASEFRPHTSAANHPLQRAVT